MRKRVQLKVAIDEDWTRGDIWRPLGVMQGWVTLKIAGELVLDHEPFALNPSVVSLLRTMRSTHHATTKKEDTAQWPLFFCCGSLWNRCGVVSDFTVRRVGDEAVFSHFHRCKVPTRAVLRAPWSSWIAALERVGRDVLRRSPVTKSGIHRRYHKRYAALREELKVLLTSARDEAGRLTTVLRMTPPVAVGGQA